MKRLFLVLSLLALTAGAVLAQAAADTAGEIPRTASGKPDLSGTYDIATLTPLQRPAEFGENLYMSPEKAQEILKRYQDAIAKADAPSEADREAPPEGGDGSPGASGNVGGYNSFWIDAGDSVVLVDGKFRTSLITDPPNGRQPPMTPEAQKARAFLADLFRPNDGTAYWLEWDRPGPWDNPENLLASDRCVASYKMAVPSLPSLYNNLQRIVQTDDYVMIMNEMVHDARVVRMNSKHAPPEVKYWLGDSIGWWEGDTLVVDTTNFKPYSGFVGTTDTLHVVERFTRKDANSVHYEFKVEDPSTWTASWSGDQIWPATNMPEERVFEYACHEGNYAMGNILRGARMLEEDWRAAKGAAAKTDK
jgi:hypothetical protein